MIFDFIDYPNAKEFRTLYNSLINKCVNIELMDAYNLSAFSSIEYCTGTDDEKPLGELSQRDLDFVMFELQS